MPSKLKKAIGAVKDQTSISLAKVSSNYSSNLEVAVLKATTHDNDPIDERYVIEVLRLVSSNKVYAASCARAIGKRIGRTRNWVVALKSLMLVLRIFQDGDPYFPREVLHAMKRGAKILNLSNFRDDSNSSPWDYTAFVRTFALYLDERLDCFLTGKLQRRYKHRETESSHVYRSGRRSNESVSDMKPAMLLDKILYWQRLLERAIATRPTGSAKLNRLVQISLYAVVKESFDLYKDISDALTLLLDSFFHLQYQSCVNAFQTCIKAVKQFEELSAFYSLCKEIGVGRTSEYPSVQTISEELIETLQEFLKDQSSFSTNGKSPNRQLLLPAPPQSLRSGRHDSYGGRSEFSDMSTDKMSKKTSEFGSQCMSLEDLISATETGRRPSISIDLEAYSEQFENKSQRDEPFRVSDTGSTRSMPISNSMVDLASLDDWPELSEDRTNKEAPKEQKEHTNEEEQDSLQPNLGTGWELVLAPSRQKNSFDAFSNQEKEHNLHSFPDGSTHFDAFPTQEDRHRKGETGLRESWELVLAESANSSTNQTRNSTRTLEASSPNNFPDHNSLPQHHYNPFLQDTTEQRVYPMVPNNVAHGFEALFHENRELSHAPTFQATPTFSVNDLDNSTTVTSQSDDDPFGSILSRGQTFNRSQQDLLQEQQLWLQQQNKIIARHIA